MKHLKNICSLVIISISKVLQRFRWELILVSGASMKPTLLNRDLLLVDKKPRDVHTGDIVVIVAPKTDYLAVKRVIRAPKVSFGVEPIYWVEGDNQPESYDSRHYGYILRSRVVGKVIKFWNRKQRK